MLRTLSLATFAALVLVIAAPSVDAADQLASLPMAALKARAAPVKVAVIVASGSRVTHAGTLHTAARIAVQFGRQAPAQAMTVETIAHDAIALARLGDRARRALERQQCPQRYVSRATLIAERYGAELIDKRDLEGAVMCLKFNAGLYRSGFRNLFFIA